MFKKISVFLILIIGIFSFRLLNPHAEPLVDEGYRVHGSVEIVFADAGNYWQDRPSEITIPLKAEIGNKTVYTSVVVKEEDARIEQWGALTGAATVWIFDDVGVNVFEGEEYLFDSSRFKVSNYKVDNDQSGGWLRKEGKGDIEIILTKSLLKNMTFTVHYDDDNGRDCRRYINFQVESTNLVNKIYEEVQFDPENSIDVIKLDNDTFQFVNQFKFITGDGEGSPDYQKLIDYTLYLQNVLGEGSTFKKIDNWNYEITIPLKAKKDKYKFKTIWEDENDSLNKRPKVLTVKAFNQEGEVEDTFEINMDNDWQTEIELFKNMKYSYGQKAINYTFEIESVDNYTFEIKKDEEGIYNIIGTYQEEEKPATNTVKPVENQPKESDKTNITSNNPNTKDNIIKYIILLIISLTFIGLCLKNYYARSE